MAKRAAGTALNRDTELDVKEAPEERGTFSKASVDVLKEREIKSARRHVTSNAPNSDGKSTFKGFTGFSLTSTNSSISSFSRPPLTSFLARTPLDTKPTETSNSPNVVLTTASSSLFSGLAKQAESVKSNVPSLLGTQESLRFQSSGLQAASSVLSFPASSNSEQRTAQSLSPTLSTTATTTTTDFSLTKKSDLSTTTTTATTATASSSSLDTVYFQFLRELNQSVSTWIKEHVDANPLIDLTPIFKDYQSYMNDIESKYEAKPSNLGLQASMSRTSTDVFSSPQSTVVKLSVPATSLALLPAKVQTSGQEEEAIDGKSTDQDDNTLPADGEESRKPLTVDDHLETVHRVRCKLFYKKEEEWTELGVGELKLAVIDTTGTQLLIRADTNIGNILLNVRLNKDTPASRSGKNNVLLVAKPNPPLGKTDDANPTCYLIRVKTAKDADDLLETIDERKKVM